MILTLTRSLKGKKKLKSIISNRDQGAYKTEEDNALVNIQIEGLQMYKRLINGLPDGYPMPINK
jgi:hypothetical protein